MIGTIILAWGLALPAAAPAPAASLDHSSGVFSAAPAEPPMSLARFIRFDVPTTPSISAQTPVPQRPVAIEYSRGYEVRKKIHVVASVATLPLFATEVILGQKLYDGNGGESVRGAHAAVAGGIGVLFGINTVTGVWNLWEGRKNPAGRGRRITHAVLMLAADAGFVLTASLAPESEDGQLRGNRGEHRAVAITSIAVATTSYLIMLLNR